MNPHLLRTFVTVVRYRSFSRAAAALGYTQSAVSQQIAALESDLATPLLSRRPVTPTSAGDRLLDHADSLLLRLDAVRTDVARAAATPVTALVIGASPLAATAGFAEDLTAVRRRHPTMPVTVRLLGREAVVTAVATGMVDLGLVDGMVAPNDPLRLPDIGPVTTVTVTDEPLSVGLPTDHPLAERTGMRLTDLVDANWIDAPDTAVALDQVRAASELAGFRPVLRYEGTDIAGLLGMVAAGHGLTLLPSGRFTGVAGVIGIPIVAPRLVHRTELLHWGALAPAAHDFVRLRTASQGSKRKRGGAT